MGSGSWTATAFTNYVNTRGYNTATSILGGTAVTTISSSYNVQDLYKSTQLDPILDPLNVVRECCDSEEHPNTIPVIFALDVTGSMGDATAAVAKQLNAIMTKLYTEIKDVQFMVMGIGDLAYDHAPIQISQFESDIRILEQLEKVWFEGGGGGNDYESYTAAWYMGLKHCKLDCWNRGKRGIIITLGDEPLNPYLPYSTLSQVTGDGLQKDIETKDLYKKVIEKYDVYHIAINAPHSSYRWHATNIMATWKKYLDDKHFSVCTLDDLPKRVCDIIISSAENDECIANNAEISW